MNQIITLESPRLQWIGVELANPAVTSVPAGVTAVIGPNGAGKSTLGRIIERGRNLATNAIRSPRPDLKVRRLEFNDVHSLSAGKVTYRQQRYESSMNDDVPLVRDILARSIASGSHAPFDMSSLLDRRVNYLSSGETRKMLIYQALTGRLPDLLILDNPYIGLDAPSRGQLDDALQRMARKGVSILLLVCDPADIPDYASAMLEIEHMTVGEMIIAPAAELRARAALLFPAATSAPSLPHCAEPDDIDADVAAAEMHGCTVSYGGVTLIDSVDWRIMPGERWVLSGPNGSGKSTLLSLIYADGPQAYSNDVRIFGRRRGTGESIWDVKRRIGYISPEMQLYFGGGATTVREVVARGLNDTVGCYTRLTEAQTAAADEWMASLGLTHLAKRTYASLSTGEQRLVLLARTLIKDAPLLLLDEPFHGLDASHKTPVRHIIDAVAVRSDAAIVFVTHCPEEVPAGFDLIKRMPPR